jgi:hypothetical protein
MKAIYITLAATASLVSAQNFNREPDCAVSTRKSLHLRALAIPFLFNVRVLESPSIPLTASQAIAFISPLSALHIQHRSISPP